MRRRGGIFATLVVGLMTLGLAGNVAAAGATMRVVPSSSTVAKDSTFKITIVQNASGPTSGAQATLTFDQTKVRVQKVERGQAHSNSPVFQPPDLPGAISQANSSGKLKTIATAFLPPDVVPAGDQDFLIITFSAIACGKVAFGLPVGPADAYMLDGTEAGYGNSLTVTTTGDSVTVDCAATGPAGPAAPVASAPSGNAPSGNAPSGNAPSGNAPSGNAPSGNNAVGVPGTTHNPALDAVAGATAASDGSVAAAANTNSPSSGSGGSLPLWLPLLLAIPALILIGFVLLRRPPMAAR
jgi:hypothetical protein